MKKHAFIAAQTAFFSILMFTSQAFAGDSLSCTPYEVTPKEVANTVNSIFLQNPCAEIDDLHHSCSYREFVQRKDQGTVEASPDLLSDLTLLDQGTAPKGMNAKTQANYLRFLSKVRIPKEQRAKLLQAIVKKKEDFEQEFSCRAVPLDAGEPLSTSSFVPVVMNSDILLKASLVEAVVNPNDQYPLPSFPDDLIKLIKKEKRFPADYPLTPSLRVKVKALEEAMMKTVVEVNFSSVQKRQTFYREIGTSLEGILKQNPYKLASFMHSEDGGSPIASIFSDIMIAATSPGGSIREVNDQVNSPDWQIKNLRACEPISLDPTLVPHEVTILYTPCGSNLELTSSDNSFKGDISKLKADENFKKCVEGNLKLGAVPTEIKIASSSSQLSNSLSAEDLQELKTSPFWKKVLADNHIAPETLACKKNFKALSLIRTYYAKDQLAPAFMAQNGFKSDVISKIAMNDLNSNGANGDGTSGYECPNELVKASPKNTGPDSLLITIDGIKYVEQMKAEYRAGGARRGELDQFRKTKINVTFEAPEKKLSSQTALTADSRCVDLEFKCAK